MVGDVRIRFEQKYRSIVLLNIFTEKMNKKEELEKQKVFHLLLQLIQFTMYYSWLRCLLNFFRQRKKKRAENIVMLSFHHGCKILEKFT